MAIVAGLIVGAASKSNSADPFDAWEVGFVDQSTAATFGSFVDFDAERVGQEGEVGRFGSLCLGGDPVGVFTDRWQVQLAGGCVDGGRRGGIGGGGHCAS